MNQEMNSLKLCLLSTGEPEDQKQRVETKLFKKKMYYIDPKKDTTVIHLSSGVSFLYTAYLNMPVSNTGSQKRLSHAAFQTCGK